MLSRYDVHSPFSPFWLGQSSPLSSTMNRLFQDFETAFARQRPASRESTSRESGSRANGALRARGPRVQLQDRGDAVSMVAELPGSSLEDIDLAIEGETVTFKVTPKPRPAPEGFTPLRRERRPVAIEWSFELPYAVDAGAVAATLEQGRLLVTFPKAAAAKPRIIPVKAA